jgi:hypothetical protein
LRGARLGWSVLGVSVETATPADSSSAPCGFALGRTMVAGDLFGGGSGIEEAACFSSAEFSGTGCGVGVVGSPCVSDSRIRVSAAARALDENCRPTVKARG